VKESLDVTNPREEVVGTAKSPEEALEKVKKLNDARPRVCGYQYTSRPRKESDTVPTERRDARADKSTLQTLKELKARMDKTLKRIREGKDQLTKQTTEITDRQYKILNGDIQSYNRRTKDYGDILERNPQLNMANEYRQLPPVGPNDFPSKSEGKAYNPPKEDKADSSAFVGRWEGKWERQGASGTVYLVVNKDGTAVMAHGFGNQKPFETAWTWSLSGKTLKVERNGSIVTLNIEDGRMVGTTPNGPGRVQTYALSKNEQ
jgi:hypothetical protein